MVLILRRDNALGAPTVRKVPLKKNKTKNNCTSKAGKSVSQNINPKRPKPWKYFGGPVGSMVHHYPTILWGPSGFMAHQYRYGDVFSEIRVDPGDRADIKQRLRGDFTL